MIIKEIYSLENKTMIKVILSTQNSERNEREWAKKALRIETGPEGGQG